MNAIKDDFINRITLEYLINSHKKQLFKQNNLPNKKDQKFYRKRILALTKGLLYEEKDTTQETGSEPKESEKLPHDIQDSFNRYIKTCIEYFKIIDKCDILQEDYLGLLDNNVGPKDNDNNSEGVLELNQEAANQLMMRSIKIRDTGMDKFVKRTFTQQSNPPPIPKQRNINLKDPNLKTKGLKQNVNSIYSTSSANTNIINPNDDKIKKTKTKPKTKGSQNADNKTQQGEEKSSQ
jgi:hypothetical protein